MSNNWALHDLGGKVTQILSEVPDAAEDHHLGRPFLTAYQIAIALVERFPESVQDLDYPLGGLGTGQQNSLAQYVAQNLSREIHAGRLPDIEGGFLSNQYLNDITFNHGSELVRSSLTGTKFTLSMYRLR